MILVEHGFVGAGHACVRESGTTGDLLKVRFVPSVQDVDLGVVQRRIAFFVLLAILFSNEASPENVQIPVLMNSSTERSGSGR